MKSAQWTRTSLILRSASGSANAEDAPDARNAEGGARRSEASDTQCEAFSPLKTQKESLAVELPIDASVRRRLPDRMRIMTARQIEEELWNTSRALVEVQKQIQRGEEAYYEETQVSHGSNLFRGWEGFIDARDVGNTNNASHHLPVGVGGNSRRMPGDFRWFSSTCNNISRHMKPFSMGTKVTASIGSTSQKPSLTKAASTSSSTKSDRKRTLGDSEAKADEKTQKGGKPSSEGRERKRARQMKRKPQLPKKMERWMGKVRWQPKRTPNLKALLSGGQREDESQHKMNTCYVGSACEIGPNIDPTRVNATSAASVIPWKAVMPINSRWARAKRGLDRYLHYFKRYHSHQ